MKINIIYTNANVIHSESSKIKFSVDEEERVTPIIYFILIVKTKHVSQLVVERYKVPPITRKYSLLIQIFRKSNKN